MNKEEKILNVVKDCLQRRSGTTVVTITIRDNGATDVKATSTYECSFCDDDSDDDEVKEEPAIEEEESAKAEEPKVEEEIIPSFDVDMDDMADDDVSIDPDAAVPALKDLLAN